MKYFLDRFEGNLAVIECEDDSGNITLMNVSRSSVSESSREGDVLLRKGEIFVTDEEETRERRKTIIKIMKDL